MPAVPGPGSLPPRRVVFLGASNVTRGLSALVETACRLWGRPLDVLAACGHGRSYGLCKGVLWVGRPGIAVSGLWEALARRPPAPTAALVTDVGNDLLYGASAADIAGWVGECLARLRAAGARVVLTPLPLDTIAGLRPARFLLLRSILFPGCRLPYAAVREQAFDLD